MVGVVRLERQTVQRSTRGLGKLDMNMFICVVLTEEKIRCR